MTLIATIRSKNGIAGAIDRSLVASGYPLGDFVSAKAL